MTKGFKITEEMPDRKYFTMVPNYIINHSTIWERDVYLIMKRIAGEGGSCYASHQTIAEMTGVSRPTISRTIKKLLKRGWIKETGKVPGKTHPTKNYVIADLWKENFAYYEEEKKRKLQNQSTQKQKDTSTTEPKIRKPQIHKEEHYKEDNTLVLRNTNGKSPVKVDKRNLDVQSLIDQLTMLLGYPPRKEQLNRFAAKRLIQNHRADVVSRAIEFAFKVGNEDRFAPKIYNYLDLEDKWEKLVDYGRQRGRSVKMSGKVSDIGKAIKEGNVI